MNLAQLPAGVDPRAFDALHDDPAAWRDIVAAIAREHGGGEPEQQLDGTVLVARLATDRVIKLYPPFLRDHFEFERAMLGRLHGRLRVPTPRLLAEGERDGWPYLVMSQMAGEPMTSSWRTMSERERQALLREVGALAAQVHALPVGDVAALAPQWDDFVRRQRERCVQRQQRTGLPAHLLEAVPQFIAGPLPEGPPVLLTGEYSPFNFFTSQNRLAAMFDFGDGLVGPREYDWLGPQCFLVAGDAARSAALMEGYGASIDDAMRLALMRLLLLHRYSNLPLQLALADWQSARGFEELAARLWPA